MAARRVLCPLPEVDFLVFVFAEFPGVGVRPFERPEEQGVVIAERLDVVLRQPRQLLDRGTVERKESGGHFFELGGKLCRDA